MCTLSFYPNKDNWIITSNRDEDVLRPAEKFPKWHEHEGKELFFAQDNSAGGSWLACSQTTKCRVLLNGAFEAHEHNPPYKKSRGLILLDSFKYEILGEFAERSDLEGIEPFTLVSFDFQSELIQSLRWNSEVFTIDEHKTDEAELWAAPMLYSKEKRDQKARAFQSLLADAPGKEELLHFHQREINILPIKSDGKSASTRSIFQFTLKPDSIDGHYLNRYPRTEILKEEIRISGNE